VEKDNLKQAQASLPVVFTEYLLSFLKIFYEPSRRVRGGFMDDPAVSTDEMKQYLEHKACSMLEQNHNPAHNKAVNDYLHKIQEADTPKGLVDATREFLKGPFADWVRKDWNQHGMAGEAPAGSMRNLQEMETTVNSYAAETGADVTTQAPAAHGHGAPQHDATAGSVVAGADPMISPQGQRFNHLDADQIKVNLQAKNWKPL
jgi:hypothetical protein